MIRRAVVPLLAIAVASTLGGCMRQARQPDADTVAAQVRKDALGLVAAYNAGDAQAAAAYDAPDYVGIFHGSPNVVGPAADEAGMKAQMADARLHWQIGEGKVTVARAGDLGIFEAPYTFTITSPNGAVSRETGNWMAIFKRQDDGALKLWRSIGSDSPAAKRAG